jgi:hypothetical protein
MGHPPGCDLRVASNLGRNCTFASKHAGFLKKVAGKVYSCDLMRTENLCRCGRCFPIKLRMGDPQTPKQKRWEKIPPLRSQSA